MGLKLWMCCPDYNDKTKKCSKERSCPHRKLHRCTFKMPDGTLCGNPSHGKDNCNHRNEKKKDGGGRAGGPRGHENKNNWNDKWGKYKGR